MKQPFESVVAEHGAMVLRVCRAVLGTHTDAEDAWSETFLAVLKAWPELPDDANVQAWLVTIAHRKAIDVVRVKSRPETPVGSFPEGGEGAWEGDPAQNAAGKSEVWRAVSLLPDKQRRVIAYRYLGGASYAQIASLLGGSEEAARRAGADAMKSLRKRVSPREPEGVVR